jgi:hypothetical protein
VESQAHVSCLWQCHGETQRNNKHERYEMKAKIILTALAILAINQLQARVKLTAVPEKNSTTIKMANNRETLVTEVQTLTLQQGINKVDFSWNGVSIIPTSIRLKPTIGTKVKLLNVSYPPAENALVWEISSSEALEEKVSISYLLNGIDKLTDYTLTVNKEETEGTLREYFVIRNFSGENFEQSNILTPNEQTIKDQSIDTLETKKLLLAKNSGVKIKKVWTFDSTKLPWDPKDVDGNVNIPVTYEIINAESNKLGKYTLPAGKVRVYQEDGSGSTIFLGEDNIKNSPVNDVAKIEIGASRDIVVTQKKMQSKIEPTKRDTNNHMILHNLNEMVTVKIENFKDTPAQLTLIENIPNEWRLNSCNMKYELEDYQTLKFVIDLPPKAKKELKMDYSILNIR